MPRGMARMDRKYSAPAGGRQAGGGGNQDHSRIKTGEKLRPTAASRRIQDRRFWFESRF